MRSLRLTLCLLAVSALLVPLPTRADQLVGSERIDFTAYALRQNEISLGIGAAAYGIADEVTVGTYIPLWLAFPLLNAPVASGYVKLRDWFHGPLAVSLRAEVANLPASVVSSALSSGARTRLGFVVVPVELSVSMRVNESFSQSMQLSWVYVGAGGSRTRDERVERRIGGASAVTSLSLHLLSEYRLSRVVALTVRESILLGSGDLLVNGKLEQKGTTVDAQLGATQVYRGGIVANVIPGIALSWANINVHLGVGIGSNWLPFLGLPIRMTTVVPDADFYVRF